MKKVKITAIIVSTLFFLYLFLTNLFTSLSFMKNPETFTFMPMVYAAGSLILLMFHFGLYVMVMDEKAKVKKIEDIEEWWTKWDRV